MSDRDAQFTNLKGEENYPPWKIKFSAWAKLKGYAPHIFGRKTIRPSPPDGASPDAAMKILQEEWDDADEKVLAAIQLKVADELLVYISKPKQTAKEAWDVLSELFEPQGTLGIVLCRRELYRAACEEGEDITEHLRKMDLLHGNLTRLGQSIPEADYALVILTSLPPSWNDFINGLTENDLKSVKTVTNRISTKLKMAATNAPSSDTALTAQSNGQPPMSQVKCYECGEMGHFAWQKHGDRRNRATNGTHKGNQPQDSASFAEGDYAF